MTSSASDLTLHQRLAEVAIAHPRVRTTFWSLSQSTLSHAELQRQSVAAAGALLARGIGRGEPVGLLCPNAPEFLIGLFATTTAGGAATPLPLPAGARQLASYPARLAGIVAAAGMRTILVSPQFAALVDPLRAAMDVEFLDTAALFAESTTTAELPRVDPDDVAVVQFTSGSTAAPKGVRLTHRQVLAGLAAIRTGIDLGPADQGGFWLPLFHDMGLIGTLSAILRGIPAHLWSPTAFVKDPERWLREFAASGSTISAMPNFGYETLLAAVPPDRAADYDLRHWRIAFNGAEPIVHTVVREFCARFRPAGFDPAAMFGVYGMAEATLAVTFPPLGREPVFDWVDRVTLSDYARAQRVSPDAEGARAVAGVGTAVAGLRLRVVDPDSRATVPDGEVGEILIRGESVTDGYLTADPASTAELFTEGWLRTGDLGYQRAGELYVTGRSKDMITVRGVNYYAHDVEAAVRDLDGVYKGRCIAAADPDGGDTIVVIAETDLAATATEELGTAIAGRIAARLGLTAVRVYPVAPRSIPRTSSGKLRRLAARELIATETDSEQPCTATTSSAITSASTGGWVTSTSTPSTPRWSGPST
ncbi:AMP-binding protein [Nocardia alba]|uniref:Acyl-CoA synthetase (AMP-forming)/AMP-acid ligase II n=1 Tax=Nocardia alba TaxID=225051 RepID=A0A4R1FPC2_9NOCA|nr:AMP-binding protein [Nocardia alba]TCJ96996.1 acyl-CoA synthetase (AMP-forming)/AMP-acid ligase II [Nocardia alba]